MDKLEDKLHSLGTYIIFNACEALVDLMGDLIPLLILDEEELPKRCFHCSNFPSYTAFLCIGF